MTPSFRSYIFSGLFLAFIFFVFFTSAQAATLYVGTSGTDQVGCGSSQGASACRTIGYAAAAASSGDTISVGAGTYNGYLSFSGIFGKNLILDGNNAATLTHTASNGEEAIVDIGSGQNSTTVMRNFTLSCGGGEIAHPGIVVTNTTPTIYNNTITGCSTGIAVNNNSGTITVRNNTVRNSTSAGIAAYGGGTAVIDSNIVHGNPEGVVVKNGTYHIINNIVYNNNSAGVTVQDLSASGNITAVVANNTLDGNGVSVTLTDVASSGSTVTVYHKNNISVNSTGNDMAINDAFGNTITVISDYNFYDSFTGARTPNTAYLSLSQWQAMTDDDDNSIENSGGAGFTNSSSRDYTLKNTSLAIGRGTDDIVGTNDLATYSAHFDFGDNDRPEIVGGTTTAVDMGAYENVYTGELTSIAITSSAGATLDDDDSSTRLTATGTYTAGSTQDLSSLVTFSSSNTGVISLNGRIAYGVAANGTSNITTSYGPVTGPAGSTITSSALALTTSGLPGYKRVYADALTGNDSTGSGSKNAPYISLATTQAQITGGERVYLSGIFTGTLALTSADSGTSSANTWITNWSDHPTVTAGTILANGGNYAIQLDGADYVTIQGLRIASATGSATVGAIDPRNGVDYLTVNNNTFDGNQIGIMNAATGAAGTNHTYSNNTIFTITTMGIGVSNINTSAIYNNLIRDVTGIGIGFFGTTNAIGLWNNTLTNNRTAGIAAYDTGGGAPTVTNLTVKNNLIRQGIPSLYGPAVRMTSAVNTGTGNSFNYNFYDVDEGTALAQVDSASYTTLAAWQAASAHDDNSVSGFALFTNVSGINSDYTLQAMSPAINAGTSTGAPAGVATALNSVARVSGFYDAGAYEVAASAPSAPTGLASASVSSTGFTLSWTDNSSYASQETNFVVKYSTTGADSGFNTTAATKSTNVTSAVIESLLPSTTYWFLVQATNTIGSTNSSSLQVITTAGGSARQEDRGQDSGGDAGNDNDAPPGAGDTPPANLRRGMDSFASLLRLMRFTTGLPIEARISDYVDFNADSAFDLQDLRAFLNYLRGRR